MPRSINWLPWCQDTFAQAALHNKPILMYLTAPWCGWGAVMDDTTYRDPEVVNLVEDNFIPMKVNVDQYPHVADRYHFGGYPSVVFLSKNGQILKGANYLSGELLIQVLKEILEEGHNRKKTLPSKKKKLRQKKARSKLAVPEKNAYISPSLEEINQIITRCYDREFGGFIISPEEMKYPLPEIHDYLILYAESHPESPEEMMLEKTLDAMWLGEIYDRHRGGFYRYAEARDWTFAHAEKMLDQNAALLRNYLMAYDKLGCGKYGFLIRDTINFFLSELYREEDQVFGSCSIGKITDFTPYTNWNSMMSSALLLAYRVLGDKGCLEKGLKVIEALWSKCYRLGRGMSHFYLNGPAPVELFSDQIKYIEALYDAYTCTDEKVYLSRASLLMRYVEKNYRLPEGTFSDIPVMEKSPGYLSIPLVPFVENIDAALVLIKMSRLFGAENYAQKAGDILKSLSPMIRGNPIFAAKYGQGLLQLEHYGAKNRISR